MLLFLLLCHLFAQRKKNCLSVCVWVLTIMAQIITATRITCIPQICIDILQIPYLLFTLSYRVATDKPPPAQNGDKFRSIFSHNLQLIAPRGKTARGMLLVDQHCGNGCSIKRAPLSVSYYNEISGGHIGRAGRLFGGGILPAQYCPCGRYRPTDKI